ncbi:AraC family transcriptional regulator [Photobacterium damselae]|uniref:AraC family transcriptional regulator n=1 Tax=Photobacterium damselae TaxID=38293 RepID=UPI001EFE2EB1|nr:helix-turn-helix domain-containing protein [Photobacterium damselae]MCG9780685.1 AraC family transcriptional regulator [Photobacterium damselae]
MVDLFLKKHIGSGNIFVYECYTRTHAILILKNGQGILQVGKKNIIYKSKIVITIPKHTNFHIDIRGSDLELYLIRMDDDITHIAVERAIYLYKNPIIDINTESNFYINDIPDIINRNLIMISNGCNKLSKNDSDLLIKQSIPFIMKSLMSKNINIPNIFKFSFEKSMEQLISHIIIQDPNSRWQMQDIANRLGISIPSLRRRLKREGYKYNQLVNKIRIELSCSYLKRSNLSISEIANRTGFRSTAYFSDNFKREYLLTPSEFRYKHRVIK